MRTLFLPKTTALAVLFLFTLISARAQGQTTTLVDEDFSAFTAGTNDQPDPTPLTPGTMITEEDTDETHLIDASLTKDGQWHGLNVYQAGGAIALMGENDLSATLGTPLKDYSGHMTVSFRVKLLSGTNTRLTVHMTRNGYLNWRPIEGLPQYKWIAMKQGEWVEASFEVDNQSADHSGSVMFLAFSHVVIDDVKVTTTSEQLAYPSVLAPTDLSATGFTAHWQSVRNADDYLFSLFHRTYTQEGNAFYQSDFNERTLPADGWTFALHHDEPFCDEGPDGSAALRLQNGDTLATRPNNARLKNMSFFLQVKGSTAVQLQDAKAAIQILVDSKTQTGGQLGFFMAHLLTDGVYIDMEEQTGGFADSYFKLSLVPVSLPKGAYFVIDDLQLETGRPFVYTTDQEDVVVSGLEHEVTGLNPDLYYSYSVKAHNSQSTSEGPMQEVVYLPSPVALEATDITDDSYTAHWEPVSKATHYEVRNYFLAQVLKDYPDYTVLRETFDRVDASLTDATDPFQPEVLGNEDDYLDDLGLTQTAWIGCGNTVSEGMVGCAAMNGEDLNYLASPEMDLSHDGGRYQIKVKAYGRVGDRLCVYNYHNMTLGQPQAWAEFVPLDASQTDDDAPGLYEGTLEMTGGSISTRLVFMSFGQDFMLDDVSFIQSLQTGDLFNQLLGVQQVEAPETSCTFSGLSAFNLPYYYYTVTALSEDYDYYTQSEATPYQRVTMASAGIVQPQATVADGAGLRLFDLTGRRVEASAQRKGIYIIQQHGKSRKIIVR